MSSASWSKALAELETLGEQEEEEIEEIDYMDMAISQILPHLFVGSIDGATNKELLKKHGVTHIVQISHDPGYAEEFTFKPDFEYHQIIADDNEEFDIKQFFVPAIQFIEAAEKSNGVVFVHCMAGVSRSVSVACAYLMKYQKLSLKLALKAIQRARPIAQPNEGFMEQLASYEKELQ